MNRPKRESLTENKGSNSNGELKKFKPNKWLYLIIAAVILILFTLTLIF